MSRSGRVTMLVGLVTLLLAGCGGGDDNKALSKAEYVKQGNAICAKGNATINAGGQKLGQAPTDAQITAFVTGTLVPTISAELKDLRALKAPKADADELSALYDEVDAVLTKVKANPSLALGNGPNDPFAAVNQKATDYGLTTCGSP